MKSHPVALLIITAALVFGGRDALAQAGNELALKIGADNADLTAGIAGMDSTILTVTVDNDGGEPATVDVDILLVDGLRVTNGMAASPNPGSYDAGTGVWSIGLLGAGDTAVLLIPVTVTAQAPECMRQTASLGNGANIESTVTIGAGQCADLRALLRVFPDECPGIEGSISIFIVREALNSGPNAATNVVGLVAGNENAPDASCTATMPCSLAPGETRLIAERELAVSCLGEDQVFSFQLEVNSSEITDPNPFNNASSQVHTVRASLSGERGDSSGGGAVLALPLLALFWLARRDVTTRH